MQSFKKWQFYNGFVALELFKFRSLSKVIILINLKYLNYSSLVISWTYGNLSHLQRSSSQRIILKSIYMWVLQPLKAPINFIFYWVSRRLWYLCVRVIRCMIHHHIVGPLPTCGVFFRSILCKKFGFFVTDQHNTWGWDTTFSFVFCVPMCILHNM
jgi:hypothetical protein